MGLVRKLVIRSGGVVSGIQNPRVGSQRLKGSSMPRIVLSL